MLFPPLSHETRKILDRLPSLIEEAFPIAARYRAGVPRDVAELSRLLTSERKERRVSYLGKPAMLSAYLRYFLPWNIYRLVRLFSYLGPLGLKPGDAVNDFGAGPLTFALALWISQPALRDMPLEIRCIDRTASVLDAGKKLFAALGAETNGSNPWVIKTIQGELRSKAARSGGNVSLARDSLSVEIRGKPAALCVAANVYNEMFWDFSPLDLDGLKSFAEKQVKLLSSLTESSGSILVVEPGIPRSGEFISLFRAFLMAEGRYPLAPCIHSRPCPMPGGRPANNKRSGKWCHFAFDTEDAPGVLHKLSAAAKLPKERAVLSFIFAGPGKKPAVEKQKQKQKMDKCGTLKVRVISDIFPIGGEVTHAKNTWGRYGCSEQGLVLINGSRGALEKSPSGALETLPLLNGEKDAKSGAIMAVKNTIARDLKL